MLDSSVSSASLCEGRLLTRTLQLRLFGATVGPMVEMRMIFRASEHEFESTQFHAVCDCIGPTLTIARTPDGHVFGGFANVAWPYGALDADVCDPSGCSFVFSAIRPGHVRDEYTLVRFPLIGPATITSRSSLGPCFGNQHDLVIMNRCHERATSFAHVPYSSIIPPSIDLRSSDSSRSSRGSDDADSPRSSQGLRRDECWFCLLGGARHFAVSEYEVYTVRGLPDTWLP